MADKQIPLGKDPALQDPSGVNPADQSGSSVTIENPDAPVNLDGYAVVDGVPQGGADDPNPKTDEIYPPQT